MNYEYILIAFTLSLIFTLILTIIFRFFGKRGLIGNLFVDVRGGIPRALGLVPYILLGIFLPPGYNDLVLIIGFFAFFDDLIGRHKIGIFPIEWGQLLRGIGMIYVMVVGFPLIGYSAILIALLIQPINISDMQPGSTCTVVIIMCIFTILATLILKPELISGIPAYYVPIVLLAICIGYAPLDYSGKIMMGEVGNHSFAVALGICFYILGGFWWTLLLSLVTVLLISLIRKNNLKNFFINKLYIDNPAPGDYLVDVLTGGGLGDLLRRIFLGKKQIIIENPLLVFFGFRRLVYNPFAVNNRLNIRNRYKSPGVLTKR